MINDNGNSKLSTAEVKRIDESTIELCWTPAEMRPSVSIFSGPDQNSLIEKLSTDHQEKGSLTISNLDARTRHYFLLFDKNDGSLMAAERRVLLEGAVNFRDIGGYQSKNGKRVNWGIVFRSDSLSRLTDNDHALIHQIGISHVFDFRTQSEISNSPDVLPDGNTLKYVHLPVKHGEFDFVDALKRLKDGDTSWLTPDFMVDGYIHNIDQYAPVWGNVINHLVESDGQPIVFHCTGGKDRTGTCAALILLALDVPEETVIYDHQLSNIYIAELLPRIYKMMESYGVNPDDVFPYLTAPKECISAVLGHITKTYGSAVEYLTSKAGVDRHAIEELRRKLLDNKKK